MNFRPPSDSVASRALAREAEGARLNRNRQATVEYLRSVVGEARPGNPADRLVYAEDILRMLEEGE